ncbi:DUF4165 domain-containing protein [Neiella marina]|uniref:DUF4165 domain-containing protein n=1 Tax=Neiella holothuriorum TaxID=2870530 RepID=A0ABS7EGD1_9GAMM|nr:DUF4165 domain-containing protein [Neiella holothuriorum]MBW8191409.1 DUF4165 domain-containing protein [Neiella holothuriorum]
MNRLLIAFGIWISVFSPAAFAAIEGFSFTDTLGQPKLIDAPHEQLNPNDALDIIISAGLDRKIRLTILNESGVQVHQATSGVVSIPDRLTFNGRDFYGKTLTTSPLPDGTYTIQAALLSAGEEQLDLWEQAITIDTTAPTANSEFEWTQYAGLGGSIEMIGTGTYSIALTNVADENQVESATFYTVHLASGVRQTNAATLDIGTAKVTVDLRNTARQQALFPIDDSEYEIGFELEDAAGNVLTVSRNSFADIVYPTTTISDVYDEDSAAWQPYTSGMVVNQNPTIFRVKLATTDLASENPDGIGIVTKGGWSFEIVGNFGQNIDHF